MVWRTHRWHAFAAPAPSGNRQEPSGDRWTAHAPVERPALLNGVRDQVPIPVRPVRRALRPPCAPRHSTCRCLRGWTAVRFPARQGRGSCHDFCGVAVFSDERGGVLRNSNWRARVFRPAVTKCQSADDTFPTITPHDLRHTAASLAVSVGANVKAVQRMLGHAKASMTRYLCRPVRRGLGRCSGPS